MKKMLTPFFMVLILASCTKYSDDDFFTAIKNGDVKTVQAIINQRDMINVKDGNAYEFNETTFQTRIVPRKKTSEDAVRNGFSGLWVAVQYNKPEIVEILLQQKFNFSEKHAIDDTIITLAELVGAERNCNPLIIKKLSENGLGFNKTNFDDERPVIVMAAVAGRWDCVDALIESGADPKAVDSSGVGLITQAVLQYENVNVDDLIQKIHGIDPLSFDANIAFIHAVRIGNEQLVKTLLNRGFNKCHTHKGKYLRDIALEGHNVATAELLPTKGQCELMKKSPE